MTGKAHLALGTATALSMCLLLDNAVNVEEVCFIGSAAIGAIFPDIDSRHSKISSRLPVVSFFTRIIVGHRGFIHTPLFLIIVALVAIMGGFIVPIPFLFVLGFCLGFLCHLLQDSFTKRGIRWLYPISDRYYSFIGLRNNFLSEIVFSVLIYVCIMLLFVFFNPRLI